MDNDNGSGVSKAIDKHGIVIDRPTLGFAYLVGGDKSVLHHPRSILHNLVHPLTVLQRLVPASVHQRCMYVRMYASARNHVQRKNIAARSSLVHENQDGTPETVPRKKRSPDKSSRNDSMRRTSGQRKQLNERLEDNTQQAQKIMAVYV